MTDTINRGCYRKEDQGVDTNAAYPLPEPDVPVVYLIAQPTVKKNGELPNLRPLAEWGDVRVLVPSGDSPTFNPIRVYDKMEDRLEHYRPGTDYLVWAGGDTLAAVFLGFLMADRGVTKFTWLRYERAKLPDGTRTDVGAKYMPIEVDLTNPQLQLEIPHEDT